MNTHFTFNRGSVFVNPSMKLFIIRVRLIFPEVHHLHIDTRERLLNINRC